MQLTPAGTFSRPDTVTRIPAARTPHGTIPRTTTRYSSLTFPTTSE